MLVHRRYRPQGRRAVVALAAATLLAVACHRNAAPAASTAAPTSDEGAPAGADEQADASAAAEPVVAPMPIPKSCADAVTPTDAGAALCLPGEAFAARLCNGSYPDVALVLMSKGTPFTRMYLRGDVDAWNAGGGMSTRARLVFDEEMLVLKRHEPPANSVVVGAAGGYQVMRWDGSCFTLEEGELTSRKPPVAKHPPIPWRRLTDRTKDALLANPKVLAAFQRRGRECKGASSGEVTKACEAADAALSAAVVTELRGGFAMPEPDPLP